MTGKTRDVDFSIVRERFSRYKLEGGINIGLKMVAERVTETVKKDKIEGDVITKPETLIKYPPNLDMEKFERFDSHGRPRTGRKLKILQRKEIINIYETQRGIILASTDLASVSFLDAKDVQYQTLLYLDYGSSRHYIPKSSFEEKYGFLPESE